MDIQLLGSITINGKPTKLGQNSLFLVLAAHHPTPVRRDHLLELLWPEDPGPEARNRLRVALSRLRAEIPLVETKDQNGTSTLLGFDQDVVQVEVPAILEQLSESRTEPDPNLERATLQTLSPALQKELALPKGSDVFDRFHDEWHLAASQGLYRLADLAAQEGDWASVITASEATLARFPSDAAMWELRIRALVQLGRGQEAQRQFSKARSKDEAGELAELAEMLPTLLSTDHERFSQGQVHLFSRVVERMLRDDLELTAAFLGSTVFRYEMLRVPGDALPILRQALALGLPDSEAKERIQVRTISCLSLLNQHSEVVKEADAFLKQEIGPARRRIALLNLSYSLFKLGEVDRAMEAIDEAIRIADETGFHFDAWQCRGQRGEMLLQLRRFPEAVQLLEGAVNYFRANPLDRDADRWVIQSNYALALARTGNLAEASRHSLEALQQATLLQADQMHALKGVHGYILLLKGEIHSGAWHLIESIRESFRTNQGVCMDMIALAGEALLRTTPADGSVLQKWLPIRQELPYPLTPIEESMLIGVPAIAVGDSHLGEVARYAIRSLRKRAANEAG